MNTDKQIVTFFGVGHAPVAPGTAGAFAGGLLFYLIYFLLSKTGLGFTAAQLILSVLTIFVLGLSVRSIGKLPETWGHDSQKIVIDEVVGVWIAMLFIPASWLNYLLAFVLFRFFDIVKPLFIRNIDQLKSSWSVMLDDVLAGVYANIVLQIILYVK